MTKKNEKEDVTAKEASLSSHSDKRIKFKYKTILCIVNIMNSSSSFANAQSTSNGKETLGPSAVQWKKLLEERQESAAVALPSLSPLWQQSTFHSTA